MASKVLPKAQAVPHAPRPSGKSNGRSLARAQFQVSRPHDGSERQADHLARTVTPVSRPAAVKAGNTAHPFEGNQPLPPSLRTLFESQMGANLGGVRIRTDDEAARAAKGLGARAFTVGNDIRFARGEFAPETEAGLRLIAHEVAHTVQQRNARMPIVQRQPSQPATEITAQDVFPFPKGSRVALANALKEEPFATLLPIMQPAVGAALKTIHGQVATVLTSGPDLFEAQIAGPVTIPATKDQPERTVRDILLSLRRTNNTFDFSLTAIEGKQTERTSLIPPEAFGNLSGMTATRGTKGIVLSQGSGATAQSILEVSGGGSTELVLKAFKDAVGAGSGTLEVIALKQLPNAETKAEADQALKSFVAKQENATRTRRQELNVGAGLQSSNDKSLLLTTSWQIRFPSTRLLGALGFSSTNRAIGGQLFQIPFEAQIQYAPDSSLLLGLSTGVNFRIPSSVPVNLRLVTGVSGGRALSEGETNPVFGPTVGLSGGIELGRWRVNLRAEHLFNVVGNGQDANSFFITLGRSR